ncbi:hypothetical protein ACLB1G_02095 [Oxalobacteraceae bacterium A2-2]
MQGRDVGQWSTGRTILDNINRPHQWHMPPVYRWAYLCNIEGASMMDQSAIETITTLSSRDAATLLMERYPADTASCGAAFTVMAHRSWKRPDQIRLARFYLRNMPFASAKPYEVLASFMSLPSLISAVKDALPSNADDLKLVAYHVAPVLRRNAKTERDRHAVDAFLAQLQG